eukprot:4472411-Ditylum_brightwellii.AAC.1
MTKKTKSGGNIYTDHFVEWFVRDMRKEVGKFYLAGSENKSAADMGQSQQQPGKVFCETMSLTMLNCGVTTITAT